MAKKETGKPPEAMVRRTVTISDSFLDRKRLSLEPGAREEFWDRGYRGFGARVGRRGASLFYRYWFAGERRRLSWRWPETSVRKALDEVEATRDHLRKGVDPGASPKANENPNGLTLAEFFLLYTEKHGPMKASRSLETDRQNFRKHLAGELGEVPIREITLDHVERRLLAIKEQDGKSGATCNRIRALLQTLFAKAQRWGHFPAERANPASLAAKFRESSRERLLTSEELAALGRVLAEQELAARPEDQAPLRVVKFLLYSGWRLSEACGLRWRDVDLERGTAALLKSKTGPRSAVIGAAAVRLLKGIPREAGQEWVFPSPRDPEAPLDRSEVRTPWARLCKAAGISGVRIHDLRHVMASTAVAGGGSLYQTSGLLGHRNPTTTQRYAHHAPDALKELADTTSETLEAQLAGKTVQRKKGKSKGRPKATRT